MGVEYQTFRPAVKRPLQTAALTFRAEPRFIDALKAYADELGVSVNNAMKDIIAPVIGLGKKLRTSDAPRNDSRRSADA